MSLEEDIKQQKFKNEAQKAAVNIIYTFNWIDAQTRDFLKKYELTPQQFNILRILRGQHPEPSTINLLKERMLDKMCDASRMVERLRLKNLLERHTCPNDRRSVDILITTKGLALLEEIDLEFDRFNKQLANLPEEELKQLNLLLDKLRGNGK